MADIDKIVEELSGLTVLEAADWSRHWKKNGASALLPRLRLRPQAVVAEAMPRRLKKRPSLTSSSRVMAARRFRSSRLCAKSKPVWAWQKPRDWWKALRRLYWKASKDEAEAAKAKLEEAGGAVELK